MEFTIKNCRVEITFLFLATLTFSLLCDRTGMAGIGLIATILHESGHVFVMNLFGIPPKRIRMNPFGIDIVAVSYTHLDVYKRQAILFVRRPSVII